jgi:GT2 family glycosyltransferase
MLLHESSISIEILVINNDPRQDVLDLIGDSACDERLRVLEMGFEAGFPKAINKGIRESTGEIVMFCNADLFPTDTYVSNLSRFFDEHRACGAAIGKLVRYDLANDLPTDVIDTAGLNLTRQRRLTPRGEGERDIGQFDEVCEVFGIDGAAMVVRREALEQIRIGDEFLDENFVTHKEDHDLSWRLRLAGWECWYVPLAVAFHGRTTRGLGSTPYRSAILQFHRNQRDKPLPIRIHAMKNQWLMLLKNEDLSNFFRDFPFILGREAIVLGHSLLFAPKSLKAIPMTIKAMPDTLRKRRTARSSRVTDPRALRRWLGGPAR